MNETEFNTLIDETLIAVEDAIEALDLDIDFETATGILTITMPNQSKIILNRQRPVRQLWMACKKNGYHFDYHDGQWLDDKTQTPFIELMNEALSDQSGTSVTLEL